MPTETFYVLQWGPTDKFRANKYAGEDQGSGGYLWPASSSPLSVAVKRYQTKAMAESFVMAESFPELTVRKITVTYEVE